MVQFGCSSDTSNNGATLYIQTQSASANAGADGALTDNNGIRVKLASQPGGNPRIVHSLLKLVLQKDFV